MNRLSVLVADDHDIVRAGLRAIIEARQGWSVVAEAVNGREAVELATTLRPDVVVLDFSMPDLNGLEATRQIRQHVPGTEVLVLTMHESERLARQFLAAGARGFVLKSDAGTQLVAALEALSSHQPFFSPRISNMVLAGYLDPAATQKRSVDAEPLTPREREIVQLVAEGRTSKEIAHRLGVSDKTVETHRTNLMNKIDCHSVVDIVRYAIRNGLVQP